MEESTQNLNAILRQNLEMPVREELHSKKSSPGSNPAELSAQSKPHLTYLQLLQSNDAPLDQLVLLKNFAKANLNHPENTLPRPIFTVIYYASIAAALKLYGKRITSLEDSALINGMGWGLRLDWIGREIAAVLQSGLLWIHNHGKS